MRTKIVIGLSAVVAILTWTCVACAPTATTASKAQLPNGETVWDLSGDWDAFVENYGPAARFGIFPTVWRLTQTGNTVTAIRLKDSPPPGVGRAGGPSLQGELETTGFKRVQIVFGSGGRVLPTTGHISEDGKKIIVDNGLYIRVTLTRP